MEKLSLGKQEHALRNRSSAVLLTLFFLSFNFLSIFKKPRIICFLLLMVCVSFCLYFPVHLNLPPSSRSFLWRNLPSLSYPASMLSPEQCRYHFSLKETRNRPIQSNSTTISLLSPHKKTNFFADFFPLNEDKHVAKTHCAYVLLIRKRK